jgi:hypothetical protein
LDENNPNVIFANDFIISYFDSPEEVDYVELYGLYQEHTFSTSLNIGKQEFIIELNNESVKNKFLYEFMIVELLPPKIESVRQHYRHLIKKTNKYDELILVEDELIKSIAEESENKILTFSRDNMLQSILNFVHKRM